MVFGLAAGWQAAWWECTPGSRGSVGPEFSGEEAGEGEVVGDAGEAGGGEGGGVVGQAGGAQTGEHAEGEIERADEDSGGKLQSGRWGCGSRR